MEGILPEYRAAINLVVDGLRKSKAPTDIGYNDMAIMIAFGQSELGIPTVNAGVISTYLGKHPAVPNNARMKPDEVQRYLDEIEKARLIDRQTIPTDFKMRDDTSQILVTDTSRLKSPQIDEFLYHGFRIHCGWALREQQQG